jgi:hypothetical protein
MISSFELAVVIHVFCGHISGAKEACLAVAALEDVSTNYTHLIESADVIAIDEVSYRFCCFVFSDKTSWNALVSGAVFPGPRRLL